MTPILLDFDIRNNVLRSNYTWFAHELSYFTMDCAGPTQLRNRHAIAQDELKLVGPKVLINNVSAWMEDSIFAEVAPASSI